MAKEIEEVEKKEKIDKNSSENQSRDGLKTNSEETAESTSEKPIVNSDPHQTRPIEEGVIPESETTDHQDTSEQPSGKNNDKKSLNDSQDAAEEKEKPEIQENHQGLDEHEDHEDHEEHEEVDYSHLSKEELVDQIEKEAKSDDYVGSFQKARKIQAVFNEIKKTERADALQKFIADGGEERDFDYAPDELNNRFEASFKLIYDHRNSLLKTLEKTKDENLVWKNEILEKLRQLVDDEETTASIKTLKEIQNEWRAAGQVPASQLKTLWANYNALLDRFYDNRSIYFELKELDRKKNLEAKLKLCERAEKLEDQENIKTAISELNELHDEFKHIGPVPKADQEDLWIRFKAASDKVYERRKKFFEEIKGQLQENLAKKMELVDQIQAFTSFDSDRISEWNAKTKELLDIQKTWDSIGGLPRDKAKEINKSFWSNFKHFFASKNAFFKKLEGQREKNLKLKQKLVEKAVELKDSTDWEGTSEVLKKIQSDWKEIGPVPEKSREEVFHRFKDACDHFFNHRRQTNKDAEKSLEGNLKLKETLCDRIEKEAEDPKIGGVDTLDAYLDEWTSIGYVPKNTIKKIQTRFDKAVQKFIDNLKDMDDEARQELMTVFELKRLKNSPNSANRLFKKELHIKKLIGNLESDLDTWNTNLDFFADSKNADKLKEEFHQKMEQANKQLKLLKKQLRIIHRM